MSLLQVPIFVRGHAMQSVRFLHEEVVIEEDDDIFHIEDSIDGEPIEQYQCGICSKIFSSKKKFIEKHINMFAKKLTCCKCVQVFENADDLYEHHESHKDDNVSLICQDDNQEEFIFMNEDEEILEIQQPTENLLYILDDSDPNSMSEVVVQEDQIVRLPTVRKETISGRNATAAQLVSLEHRYILPENSNSSTDDLVMRRTVSIPSSSSSKTRLPPQQKARTPLPKKRHEVPDFSATNPIVMQPNQELDALHYKCQRCEQLFINRFGFFRHIEKGKCYVNSCDVCNNTFSSNKEFYMHYVAEHADRAVCSFCFRTFMYEKNVKEHMLRHLDQFRHRCEDCNKGFYTVREYRNHYKNRHMGIRHKCEVCGRSFADEYYFKKHMATHAKATNANITFVEMQD